MKYEVFCKKNAIELLNVANLSKEELQLLNECREAFECKMRVLDYDLTPGYELECNDYGLIAVPFNITTKDSERLDVLTQITKSRCEAMIIKMRENNVCNYEFLDLLLYNSIYIYSHTNTYKFVSFDEFRLPLVETILSQFWNEFNHLNFPLSYKYFSQDFNCHIKIDEEDVMDYSHLLTYHMNNVINFKEKCGDVLGQDIITYIKSINWLLDSGIDSPLSNEELNLLASFNFNKFHYNNINTLITLPNLIFEYSSLKDVENINNVVFKTIIKKLFDYLKICCELLELEKESWISLDIDTRYGEMDKLVIEKNIRKIPFENICEFYDDLEYELSVNAVLNKILQIAYHREYKRKLEFMKSMFSSKEDLEEYKSIPF